MLPDHLCVHGRRNTVCLCRGQVVSQHSADRKIDMTSLLSFASCVMLFVLKISHCVQRTSLYLEDMHQRKCEWCQATQGPTNAANGVFVVQLAAAGDQKLCGEKQKQLKPAEPSNSTEHITCLDT